MKKRLFITLGILTLATAIMIVCFWLFVFKDDTMHVVELQRNEGTSKNVAEFKNSFMNVYKNGTFDIKIIKTNENGRDEIQFVGIGTWEKDGKEIILRFMDFADNTGITSTRPEYTAWRDYYKALRCEWSGKLHFEDYVGRIFYFA